MSNAKIIFDKALELVLHMDALHDYLSTHASSMDNTGILRSEYVLLVSAFDTYLHSLLFEKIKTMFYNAQNLEKIKISLPLQDVMTIHTASDVFQKSQLFDASLRRVLAKNTYQSPKSVEDVMSMIGIRRIWTRVGRVNNLNSDTARNKLAVIVNRRNKIAHEADYDLAVGCFTALSKEDVMDVRNYLCSIVDVIEENLERQQ